MTDLSQFSLKGRVAIVTGGSSGIGLGIALGLARAGAGVVVAARTPDRVEAACRELQALGRRALGVPADVTKAQDVEHLVQRARQEFGHIDILVNNAGGSFGPTFNRGPLLTLTEQDFEECMAVNVKSSFLCCKATVPLMMDQGGGSIINVASIGGLNINPPGMGFGFYSASKAALVNLSRLMAAEWGPKVRVNCIAPGMIDTPRVVAAQAPERTAAMVRGIALERPGLPQDVAGAAVFLASDAASWVTGMCLDVHGGQRNPDRV